jgi:outer membrane protein OmpA-like peptidoglycan-associated protein
MAGFCGNCGSPLNETSRFCGGCGAQVPAPPSPAAASPYTPVSPPPQPTYAPVPSAYVPGAPPPAPGGKKSNTLLKVIIAVLVLLFVGGALAIAGLYYAALKVKEKVHTVTQQVLGGNVPSSVTSSAGGLLGTNGAETGATGASSVPAPSSFTAWSAGSSPGVDIRNPAPLKVGMLVVTAIADARGDYESFKQIVSIEGTGTTLSYHSDKAKPGTGQQGATAADQETSVTRKVLSQDLNSAHEYAEIFGPSDPLSYPGTTAISASREVFAELEQKGVAPFSFHPDGVKGALGSLVSKFSAIAGVDNKNMGGVSLDKLEKEQCTLRREGQGLFAFPVLLNAQPVTLPALRAGCMTDDGPADFYILDQPNYPLMLSWKLGSGSQLQVIKITYPPPPQSRKNEQPSVIEQQLKEKKKVDIYGIYFDFASDRLKPESAPVLLEIAGVLKDNPNWDLTVSGHTDNVGGDNYNLDLSKRRAAAVKQALVTQYHIAPDRLSTDGFGATRPVDTNDTLAGRARNRRVELTRE